jgi:hypothetical protein
MSTKSKRKAKEEENNKWGNRILDEFWILCCFAPALG